MRFVLDNSVTMRWLFGDGSLDDLDYASRIIGLMEAEGAEAVVPSLWPLEVAVVIVRAEAKGLLVEARSAEFLGVLQEMAISTDAETPEHALNDTLQLARRFKLSSYDASIWNWRFVRDCLWRPWTRICVRLLQQPVQRWLNKFAVDATQTRATLRVTLRREGTRSLPINSTVFAAPTASQSCP